MSKSSDDLRPACYRPDRRLSIALILRRSPHGRPRNRVDCRPNDPDAPVPPAPSSAAPSRLGPAARWALALAAPAVPLAAIVLAHVPVAPEVQRLALLAVVALVGGVLGTGPALLAAIVATVLGWYRPDVARFVVDLPADQVAIGAFAVAALLVAALVGPRRATVAEARALAQRADRAEREEAARRQVLERATAEATTLRAAVARSDRELADARAAADRAERSRRAILDSLPPDLRAPHIQVPVAVQLFPPLLAAPPIGLAPPLPTVRPLDASGPPA